MTTFIANEAELVVRSLPSQYSIQDYYDRLIERNITRIVVAGGDDAIFTLLQKADPEMFQVFDCRFPSGDTPEKEEVALWRSVLSDLKPGDKVSVTCPNGYSCSGVLVAIALINDGIDYPTAIAQVQAALPGALNFVQTEFLVDYRSKTCCALL